MKLETHRSFLSELQLRVVAANARHSTSHAVKQLWTNDQRLWKDDPTDTTKLRRTKGKRIGKK